MGFVSIAGGDVSPRPPYTGGGYSGSVFANEPVGYTLIHDNPWDSFPAYPATYLGWDDNDYQGAASALTTIVDPTSPYPWVNHNVCQLLFPVGSLGGSAVLYIKRLLSVPEQFKNVFIGLYCKHDANFDNTNGNTGTKFMWVAGDMPQGGLMYTGHDTANMDFKFFQQGAVDRALDANLDFNAARLLSRRGQWVKYEWLLKANTANGTANGELHVWIDGVKTHQFPNAPTGDLGMDWQMDAARTWKSLVWNPTYGGGLNPVPHDQWQYLDHLRILGSNT